MSNVGTNGFTKAEDLIIIDHWAECQGDPRLLAKYLPNRTTTQVSQHINKSKTFKSLLYQHGFKTKSDKFEEQFQLNFLKRKASPDITANVKMEEPLCKRACTAQDIESDSGEDYSTEEHGDNTDTYNGYHFREVIEHENLEEAEQNLHSQIDPMGGCGKEEKEYLKLGASKCRIMHNTLLEAQAIQIATPLIEILKDGLLIAERTSPNHSVSFSVDFLTKTLSVEKTSPAIQINTLKKIAQHFKSNLLDNLDHELKVKPYSTSRTEIVLRIPDEYELAEAVRSDIKIDQDTYVGFFIPKRDRIKTFTTTQFIEYESNE